jgi:hypothetical protein
MKITPLIILGLLIIAFVFPFILSFLIKPKKSKAIIGKPSGQMISDDYLKSDLQANFISKPNDIKQYIGGKSNYKSISKERKRILLNG